MGLRYLLNDQLSVSLTPSPLMGEGKGEGDVKREEVIRLLMKVAKICTTTTKSPQFKRIFSGGAEIKKTL